jgi:hypothetical protein
MKERISESFRHVVRIDGERKVNMLLQSTPVGRTKKGRPGLRWMDDGF